ncbi:MAG TPA: kynureninase [Stellaceae bacterium]|nr:kynureninase [Stellaceae bacterium]
MIDRKHCEDLDRRDPLARFRERFVLPEGVIYLDGNSLGPLLKSLPERIRQVVEREWGQGLIRSWNAARWIDLPQRVGDKIAPLIGAEPGEVVAADSTSVNLFKLLSAALDLQRGRSVILSERDNFPTDLYVAQGVRDQLGGRHELKLVEAGQLRDAIDEQVAVVMLTHVNFRTGSRHDMAATTAAAHARGALVLWDLSHSVGAMPLGLGAARADLAIGCGYKYLNGGPGAPAFLYVRRDLQSRIRPPLAGWMGHREPFAFVPDYAPAEGILRNLCGTPPVLAMAALDAALDLWSEVDLSALRAKSVALADLMIELVEEQGSGLGLTLATTRDAERRGSQVSFAHPEGYAVMQALIARNVIGDYRAPDLIRFGLTPLYLRYVDVFDAVTILTDILRHRHWDRSDFRQRARVT